jgi:hypothetical protein
MTEAELYTKYEKYLKIIGKGSSSMNYPQWKRFNYPHHITSYEQTGKVETPKVTPKKETQTEGTTWTEGALRGHKIDKEILSDVEKRKRLMRQKKGY